MRVSPYDTYEDATVLTDKQSADKSTRSRSNYSMRSFQDQPNGSHPSYNRSPPSIIADVSIHPRSHSMRSIKSSTRGALHHKPAKPRAKLNEKFYWDGHGSSFLTFRRAIEGHLLQAGASYLLDTHFLYHYKLNPSACQVEQTYHHTSDIWI